MREVRIPITTLPIKDRWSIFRPKKIDQLFTLYWTNARKIDHLLPLSK